MTELIARLLLFGRHYTTVVVGGVHWRYCSHRTHGRGRRCWNWMVYDGYCTEHNNSCWSACSEGEDF